MKSMPARIAVTAATFLFLTSSAWTQEWPKKSINIVVGFDSGGSVDRMARGLAGFLSTSLGQPIVVTNRPGASGQVATTWFLQQPPDGHTLMISPAAPYLVTNILSTGAKYRLTDFAFVNAQWIDYSLLAVGKDKPYKSAGELINAIKSKPGKISAGVTFGSIGHVTTLVLTQALGLSPDAIRIVTFDGGGALRTALAGGHVDFSITGTEGNETVQDFVRILAVFSDEPLPQVDAPPINDVLKPYNITLPVLSGSVRTLVAPAEFRKQHPVDYEKLVAAYKKVLDMPEYQAWLKNNNIGGDWVGPDETAKLIQDNFDVISKYQNLLKQ